MSGGADAKLHGIVKRGAPDGAYFLHGEAEAACHDAAQRLIEAALDPSIRDFNLDSFYGDRVEPERLAAALAMPPMMADRRVVVLYRAQGLTPTGRKAVQSALDVAVPDLLFIVTARIPDRSSAAFWRQLRRDAVELHWKAPREAEVPGYLMERARSAHGFELTADAAQAFAASVGASVDLLEAELVKLAATGERRVTAARVRELVPNLRPVDRWSWLDRVAGRDYAGARRELPALLAEPSESAVGLLIGMIEQHIYVGLALEGGAGLAGRVLGESGKPYLKWKAKTYASQAARWSRGALREAFRVMHRADARAKSGASDAAVLEELLFALELVEEERAA